MRHTIHHWDENRPEKVEADILLTDNDASIDIRDFEDEAGRSVSVEVRNDHTVAVICYQSDRAEPVVVLLPAAGGHLIKSDAAIRINAESAHHVQYGENA